MFSDHWEFLALRCKQWEDKAMFSSCLNHNAFVICASHFKVMLICVASWPSQSRQVDEDKIKRTTLTQGFRYIRIDLLVSVLSVTTSLNWNSIKGEKYFTLLILLRVLNWPNITDWLFVQFCCDHFRCSMFPLTDVSYLFSVLLLLIYFFYRTAGSLDTTAVHQMTFPF